MNYFFEPTFQGTEMNFQFSDREFSHAKVLRLAIGDSISLLNGKGTIAICVITEFTKKHLIVTIQSIETKTNSLELSLAVGILDNKDRFEFLIEKATELGVKDFYPLKTAYSAKESRINIPRLEQKVVSAMKQSGNPLLMNIHPPQTIEQLLKHSFETIVVADKTGEQTIQQNSHTNQVIIIGPEGGLSQEELLQLRQDSRVQLLQLPTNRLRAETAAIAVVSRFL
jgi:16S rRNA (uracil1498-N3)-methyltransferase